MEVSDLSTGIYSYYVGSYAYIYSTFFYNTFFTGGGGIFNFCLDGAFGDGTGEFLTSGALMFYFILSSTICTTCFIYTIGLTYTVFTGCSVWGI